MQEKMIMLKQQRERERMELEYQLRNFQRNLPDSAGFAPESVSIHGYRQNQNYAPQPEDIMLEYRF